MAKIEYAERKWHGAKMKNKRINIFEMLSNNTFQIKTYTRYFPDMIRTFCDNAISHELRMKNNLIKIVL